MNRNAILSSGSILDRIVATKRDEVGRLRTVLPDLRRAAAERPAPPAFAAALTTGPRVSVIAEVKRRSPSAGAISVRASAPEVAASYARAGASAISVLTDEQYFGGSLNDLRAVAKRVATPLLRKDFVIDETQLFEARAAGASAVLLIVRILDDVQLRDYGALAAGLDMAALVEVHDEAELERALAGGAAIVGVNNRDLASFATDLSITERLAPHVPDEVILVGESGIGAVGDVERMAAAGVAAVLVGESLMRAEDPAALLATLASVART